VALVEVVGTEFLIKSALRLALDGHLLPHHRFLLRDMLDELAHIEGQLARLEAEIERNMPPFQKTLQAWMSIPGIKQRVAWTLVAEIGPDMQVFPSPAHIASWVGVCPGNNESAGKRKSGKTRKGNCWARRALCEAAWVAAKAKKTYLAAQFRRLAATRGSKRAIIAVAPHHSHNRLSHTPAWESFCGVASWPTRRGVPGWSPPLPTPATSLCH